MSLHVDTAAASSTPQKNPVCSGGFSTNSLKFFAFIVTHLSQSSNWIREGRICIQTDLWEIIWPSHFMWPHDCSTCFIMWPLNATRSHSFPESVSVSAALRRSSGGWRGGKQLLIQGVGWRWTGSTNAEGFIRSNQFGINSLRDSVFLRFYRQVLRPWSVDLHFCKNII